MKSRALVKTIAGRLVNGVESNTSANRILTQISTSLHYSVMIYLRLTSSQTYITQLVYDLIIDLKQKIIVPTFIEDDGRDTCNTI